MAEVDAPPKIAGCYPKLIFYLLPLCSSLIIKTYDTNE